MSKYGDLDPRSTTALKTTDEQAVTHEGAPALAKDVRTALFTLAMTSMTAQDSFYESAATQDSRLRGLVQQLTEEDPEFIQRFVPWLRNTANMRSAPIVIAAEYALAGGPHRRQVIDSAMVRADEPAEFVGYYIMRTGRSTLPGGIQRGVADAVQRLYNQFSALKYDSQRHTVRMGDVIELVHPQSKNEIQGLLYEWLLDRRHHSQDVRVNVDELPMIKARQDIEAVEPDQRREVLRAVQSESEIADPTVIRHAADAFNLGAITWEYLSGWLPGGMDAEAWEVVIPQMGYMALLRNLRNFDEAKISDLAIELILQRLADPEEVAKSRQFPYRFWSAWAATQSLVWGPALETALGLSVHNIPEFSGSTLVLVDVSGSMVNPVSDRSQVNRSDVAALFGAALFAKNPKTTRVVIFGTDSKDVTPAQRGSMLRNMEVFRDNHGVGHGTYLGTAVGQHFTDEDRIVIFTDLQAHDGGAKDKARFVHYFDLGGYSASPDAIGEDGVFMYGGFTDATFRQMSLHEITRTSDWNTILT
ncbi:hypothetical protein LCGC14_2100490 [marine sediment metagenome]|uniref:TROVE domain-containing protein n=1 Tax=marine sediment metagenome TaxID=412755 RepID=A0A0F9EA88_9ZZZZ